MKSPPRPLQDLGNGTFAVPLSRGDRPAIISAEDADRVCQYNWSLMDSTPHLPYAYAKIGGKAVMLHRFILGVTDRTRQVDHWDHDGLNNVRSNLRECSRAQNLGNTLKRPRYARRPCTSQYKGVCWHRGKWQAGITMNGKSRTIGRFNDEEAAAHAYDRAAREYFGSFAVVNFPSEGEAA